MINSKFLLAISIGIIALIAIPVRSEVLVHPILPAPGTVFESTTKRINFTFTVSPITTPENTPIMEIRIDDSKSYTCKIVEDHDTFYPDRRYSCSLLTSEFRKADVYTHSWTPRFKSGITSKTTTTYTFSFREGPSAPETVTVKNSATPFVSWTHCKTWGSFQEKYDRKSYRIWAKSANNEILLGTVDGETNQFDTPNEKALSPGTYKCVVEALVNNSLSAKTEVEFTVPAAEAPAITLDDQVDSTTNKPELSGSIDWKDGTGAGNRELVIIYGSGNIAGSVNDKKITIGDDKLDGTSFGYTFEEELESQIYHWYVRARNKAGVLGYSDVKTFLVNVTSAPKPVTAIEPANNACISYKKANSVSIPLKWQGLGWGFHGDSDSIEYIVSCTSEQATCTIAYDNENPENSSAIATVSSLTGNDTTVTWNVTASNGESSSINLFTFTLRAKPETLSAPKFNQTQAEETSAPKLDLIYTLPTVCDNASEDQLGKIVIELTQTGDNKETRFYEVKPDVTSFTIPDTLSPGSWSASLVAMAPGYEPVRSPSPTEINVCRSGPLQRPNITRFENDVNNKNVYINFTIAKWSDKYGYCNTSNTLKNVDVIVAYNDTTTSDTLDNICELNGDVYECYYEFLFHVVGTSFISLAARNNEDATSYSNPYKAVLFSETYLDASEDVTLYRPQEGVCIPKEGASLSWDPLALGYVEAESSEFGFKVELNGKTYDTSESRFDVSNLVVLGALNTWSVRPKGSSEFSNSGSFSVYDNSAPSIDSLVVSNTNFPITISWTTSWKNDCRSRSQVIAVDGNVVAVVDSQTSSYTFNEDSGLFKNGAKSTVKVIAYQGNVKIEKSVEFTPVIYTNIPPPELITPEDGAEINSSSNVLSWEECSGAGVTYKVMLKSAFNDFATEITTGLTSISINETESGMYYWAVCAIIAGKESPYTSYRSFFLSTVEVPEQTLELYWPLDGATVTASQSVTFSWENLLFAETSDVNKDRYELIITKEGTPKTYTVMPGQSSLSVRLDEGSYTWTVNKINDIYSVNNVNSYTLNVVESKRPNKPVIKDDEVRCLYPQTLSWNSLSTDDWGSASCDFADGYQSEYLPERACTYMVFLGTDEENVHFIGRTRNNSFTLPDKYVAIRGTYYWKVAADNGFVISEMSDVSNFTGCTLMPPQQPPLISPDPSTFNLPQRVKFEFVDFKEWGDTCNTECTGDNCLSKTKYILNLNNSYGSVNFTDVFDTVGHNETTGYSYVESTFIRGTFTWDITVVNEYGLSSSEPETRRTIGICENISVTQPILNDPLRVDPTLRMNTALIDGGKDGIRLSWKHYSGEDFGNLCPTSRSTYLKLYFWTSQNETFKKFKVIENTDYILLPFPEMLEKLGIERFDKNINVSFQLNATNSDVFIKSSEIVTIPTVSKDCSEITCENGGSCDEITLECICLEGYTGVDCSEEVKKGGGISDGLKYGLIGLACFLFIVIVVIIIIAVHYYSKHKKSTLRPPPNFEELRVPPIKRPNYIQNINGSPDEKLMEKALLDEDSFPLVWAIFRAAGVTEADRLSKALLYFYQKQGKGLEFILFLINREISETKEPSVLFRANSPATRAFKFYSKMIGLPYLFRTFAVMLQGIIRDINDAEEDLKEQKKLDEETSAGSGGVTLGEIDPDNIDSRVGDENINVLTLQLLCQKFLLQIVRSDKNCPGELKHVCAFLKTQLENKFPETVYKGVGAFIFLRFYNTAITVPESYGLMENAPEQNVRRQLILISKVLQNLANGVQFGDKEKHMIKLNGFLDSSRPQYEKFITKICDNTAAFDTKISIPDSSYDAAVAVVLSLLYTIAYNDPDKFEDLNLPQDLHDSIVQSLPSSSKKSKKHKHRNKKGGGDGADAPLMAEENNKDGDNAAAAAAATQDQSQQQSDAQPIQPLVVDPVTSPAQTPPPPSQ